MMSKKKVNNSEAFVDNDTIVDSNENVNVKSLEETDEFPVFNKIHHGTVICDRLNVRSRADINSNIVTVLTKGTEVSVNVIDNSEWLEYVGKGFVMAKFIKLD